MGNPGDQRHYEQQRDRMEGVFQSPVLSQPLWAAERLGAHPARQRRWRFSGIDAGGSGAAGTSPRVAKVKNQCRLPFCCRAGCRSGCRAKIPKALILRHFSLSDNHDNQYYKEKGNSKKIVSPDKEKRFSDVRCRNFVVRPFLVGLFHSRRNIV